MANLIQKRQQFKTLKSHRQKFSRDYFSATILQA